jgi:hypothetical protein
MNFHIRYCKDCAARLNKVTSEETMSHTREIK